MPPLWRNRSGAKSPSPHGEGGLKYHDNGRGVDWRRPSPHGEGGLKYSACSEAVEGYQSLPTRGGWIEISLTAPMS